MAAGRRLPEGESEGLVRVEVLNWRDYLTRSDIKSPTFFAFPVKFFVEPEYMGAWTPEAIALLGYLVAQATRSNGVTNLVFAHASGFLGLSDDKIRSALVLLEHLQLVHVSRRNPDAPVQIPCTGRDGTGRDGEEAPAAEAASIPVVVPSVLEPAAEEGRTYDRDHESVAVKAKPDELPRLALIWNLRRNPVLSEVRLCSASRRKHAVNRWKENPSEDFWLEVIERINASAFCLGKNNRGWKADFDFLCRPDSAAKVLEGKYDNPGGPGGGSPSTPKLSYWARQQGGKNV